jgi:archaeosine synthase
MTMHWQIHQRDGQARIGLFTYQNKTFTTPNLLETKIQNESNSEATQNICIGPGFFFTKDHEPNTTDLLIENYLTLPGDMPIESYKKAEKLTTEGNTIAVLPPDQLYLNQIKNLSNIKIAIVSYAAQLLRRQTYASKYLTNLRNTLILESLIYLPAIATPTNLSILSYLGIDLFDFGYAQFAAKNSILLFPEGNLAQNNIQFNPCVCPICQSKDVHEISVKDVERHNFFMLYSELKKVKNAISRGCLRELVEIRVRADPQLAALLHILDVNHYEFFEKQIPLYRKIGIQATSSDALWRPEIQRFQRRICEWYQKPLSAKILLLLPCSARKPYSRSKTHKKIHSYLRNVRNFGVIHEIIVTSPLGIVPRELEMIYPASSYDISVTGLWSKDEQDLIRKLFSQYLKINKYDHIVIHLPRAMQNFITDMLPSASISCLDTPTSDKSLSQMIDLLSEYVANYPKVDLAKHRFENIRSLMTYQFGPQLTDILLKNCEIKGRGPYYRIIKNNLQLGMISSPRGFVSLTLEGAKYLHDAGGYWVIIDKSFKLKGSLFSPGVIDADEKIRIGDEVCILQNDKVVGVGVAQMNGDDMKDAQYGEAVKIRHHAVN